MAKSNEKAHMHHQQLEDKPQMMQSYSGFPSIQLESYYDRIQMKVMEFLCTFIVQCLAKDVAPQQNFNLVDKAI